MALVAYDLSKKQKDLADNVDYEEMKQQEQ